MGKIWDGWDRVIEFKHKGKSYIYQMERDREEDVIKNFHYLNEQCDGRNVQLNYHPSPYSWPSKQDMKDWIDDRNGV